LLGNLLREPRQREQALVEVGDQSRQLGSEVLGSMPGSLPGLAQGVGEVQELLSGRDRKAGSQLPHALEVIQAGIDQASLIFRHEDVMDARPLAEGHLRPAGKSPEESRQQIPSSHPSPPLARRCDFSHGASPLKHY
jgi:hypothetical protein